MKKVIDRASSRGYFNHGWLKTHHTFSFANYYNPNLVLQALRAPPFIYFS